MKNKEQFKGQLGAYSPIQTADGSWTLWSEAFDENCHSLAGAAEETLCNYIEATNIANKYQNLPIISALEVGFGTGQGALLTYLELSKYQNGHDAHFISLEIDEGIVKWAIEHAPEHSPISQLSKKSHGKLDYYHCKVNFFQLFVLIGDARKTIEKIDTLPHFRHFDVIYQDAFSPKKNAILWTVEWFTQLAKRSQREVILSTYSASSAIRKSLICAGWYPQVRPGFKGKRESTIANLTGPISQELSDHLNRSPLPPLYDHSVKSSPLVNSDC